MTRLSDEPQPGAGIPATDVVVEARRLLDAADARGVPLRALGGAAVRLRLAGRRLEPFSRTVADIDCATTSGNQGALSVVLAAEGYSAEREFNALHGRSRLLFVDERNHRRLDLFVDTVVMSHRVPLRDRLLVDPQTIPLAELLVTKLQVVGLEAKDRLDACALLANFEPGHADGDEINLERIAALTARDWGLHRTVELNIDELRDGLTTFAVDDDLRALIDKRLRLVWESIESAPKSPRWRLRRVVGDRVRRYEEPEEAEAVGGFGPGRGAPTS